MRFAFLILGLLFAPVIAQAQAAGPTMAAAESGIRANVATENLTAQESADRAAHGAGLGTGTALLIVGGAAFVTGLIIGGGAGTALAVGGVLVAAYGLYVLLR